MTPSDREKHVPAPGAGDEARQAPSTHDVAAFLEAVRRTPQRATSRRGRLIVAIDATASREPTWDLACRLQGEMFRAADEVGGLDVQLVFYRGFGECKASRWHDNAATLVKDMTAVRCLGGQTQIGRVLRHGVIETGKKRVHALVFIGDAMEEDIDAVCARAGELGLRGVPVFLFQEGADPIAEKAFRQIATLTRGAYCRFDHGSADQLKALLGAVATFAAGGIGALENYAARETGGRALLAEIRRLAPPDASGKNR